VSSAPAPWIQAAGASGRQLRVALVTLGDPRQLSGGYLYHLRLAELAPRHGARVDFVSFPERPFPFGRLAARRVGRAVAALEADAVALDSLAAAYFDPAAPGVRERPLVAILHQLPGGIGHGRLRTALQARLDRRAYAGAHRLLAASASLAADLTAAGLDPAKLRVVPPGRDVEAGDTAEVPVVDRKALRAGRGASLLCVGGWLPHKGQLDLLEAFASLPPALATLHLAGDETVDPTYAARVRERLAQPDLAGRVVCHGRLARRAVAALYAAADVFVLASTVEAYGTVYGEALAAGLPVVGWRAGNLPHLVTDGVEGRVVATGDLAGLTAALRELADDPALRERMAAAARRRAAGLPTWDETTAAVLGAIREAVAAHPGRRR
jgi:glycosyltransferase involved in cell wall biosynthesis